METQKKRRGDRKDGRLMRELDSLHYVTGILYPNRCDNEAYISQPLPEHQHKDSGRDDQQRQIQNQCRGQFHCVASSLLLIRLL